MRPPGKIGLHVRRSATWRNRLNELGRLLHLQDIPASTSLGAIINHALTVFENPEGTLAIQLQRPALSLDAPSTWPVEVLLPYDNGRVLQGDALPRLIQCPVEGFAALTLTDIFASPPHLDGKVFIKKRELTINSANNALILRLGE
jgi:hypothetical protein